VPVIIGTSGWQYDDWRGRLYPRDLAQARWLGYYAERFQSVEVNNAFYRLPEISTFERWRDTTPDDFLLTIKASRYLTHVRRLHEPTEPVHRLMSRATHLEHKLGPILIQLPANFRADIPALRCTLDAFPAHVRIAFEPRHDSWYQDATEELLAARNVAFCLSDTPDRKSPIWRTADWGYLRFHQGRATPAPCYGRTALRAWAERLAELWGPDDDVFAYFNNDQGGCAVRDAHRFALAAGHAGLRPTRVPSAKEASLSVEPAAG
jgi:uncharacterized protein YecE (DUF72 family)